jgi:hypothetical protein
MTDIQLFSALLVTGAFVMMALLLIWGKYL